MTAQAGLLAAILAFMFALLQGAIPLLGAWHKRAAWMSAAPSLALGQFLFLSISLLALTALFVTNDFSVLYVANNSNTELPLIYRITAVWGGHEGSLLLWSTMLAAWSAALSLFSRQMPADLRARVVGVLGLVSAGFLAFMLWTSNPFDRLFPAPEQGRDLNPLLQDPGLAVHPPMLYMGYVGFSAAFALAVAALMSGRMDSAWAKWARPWTLAAWIFLTVGIMLGSWWAYYELGWGGWWFWDPVENASFMPWLAGTALIHSLAATEARGVFKPWTALLAILTFALCLLGTFLVRSGVLTSVHAFAVDPSRGAFILLLLAMVTGGSLMLYAWRAPSLSSGAQFAPVSREGGILLNNIFLTVAAFSVLLGTLYPLILDALGAGKISVGPPYFNAVFAPIAAVPAAFCAIGALGRWKRDSVSRLTDQLKTPFCFALVLGTLLPFLLADEYKWTAAPGLVLAFWILFGAIVAAAGRKGKAGAGFWGMIIAHSGVAFFVFGVTMIGAYEIEKDVKLSPGESQTAGEYVFEMRSVFEFTGPNYAAIISEMPVYKDKKEVAVLYPEKRRYFSNPDAPTTEAGIAARIHGDIYASLGEPLGDGAWSARLQIKPFVRFIWGGALLMALGGLIAAADRRYRRRRKSKEEFDARGMNAGDSDIGNSDVDLDVEDSDVRDSIAAREDSTPSVAVQPQER